MIRDHAPARHAMKSVPICVLLFLLSAGVSSVASAGSQLSPVVRIVVLEVGVTPDTLRLGVRKRLMHQYPNGTIDGEVLDTEVLNFNPATCTSLQAGFNGNSTGEPTDYFDIQLNAPGRSAEDQRRLLNMILLSFMTGRSVRLYVRDDLCTNSGGRVAAGIAVN
jgi:hypothetical protein